MIMMPLLYINVFLLVLIPSTINEFSDPAAAADIDAFEGHLQQVYLYYKAKRRRGQG